MRKAYEQRAEDVERWLGTYPRGRKRALNEKGQIFWGDETKVINVMHASRSYALVGEIATSVACGSAVKRKKRRKEQIGVWLILKL